MRDVINKMISGEIPHPTVARLVGFKVLSCKDGTAKLSLQTTQNHYNPMGTVHGGILCDIADAAMGIAFASTLEEGESFTTIDLQMSYLRPVWVTTLMASAKVIKRGRTIGLVECEIMDANEKLVAKGNSNCMVLRGEEAKGR
ncbi:PaaI family thioesterase [Candidatus Acetothermia bacterium]|nr:PaaI family thioesterase [Candidatus Acetothermia bacterium]MBI3643364.1 PaaI family thioesterase [Candidatus Acetothermia bacterium]